MESSAPTVSSAHASPGSPRRRGSRDGPHRRRGGDTCPRRPHSVSLISRVTAPPAAARSSSSRSRSQTLTAVAGWGRGAGRRSHFTRLPIWSSHASIAPAHAPLALPSSPAQATYIAPRENFTLSASREVVLLCCCCSGGGGGGGGGGGEGMDDLKEGGGTKRRAVAAGVAPLSRQGSIYSLTFDEFQSTLGGMGSGLGKDFGSMNMDELLRSIWTAEESHAMASASGAGAAGRAAAAADGELQRQGSLTLPCTLSVKTVDEIWRDFAREASPGAVGGGEPQPSRQPTLGEMTLEEFLVRAGVVRENPAATAAMVAAAAVPSAAPRPIHAINNSSIFFGNFGGANEAAGAGAMGFSPVGVGNPAMDNEMMSGVARMRGGAITVAPVDTSVGQLDSAVKGDGDMSSPMAPAPYPFEGVIRGRRSGGNVEKVVERRHRRMIKNRESAARSRARKQAYTMELEAEVEKLKEQNKELQKKQREH
ncbi:hypothetical protein GUJ93_ZPchr0010g7496 [Zizania palustris]|uniref:BZIP domain-containing protein n=1 Tax=Zizania palustris TaxID=103762 RepID=A0A8J6BLE4_ZIZPA|nr:hypothetical protein GUJ93_ZPchr0010g7496 [Zizania palustris]